MDPAIRTPLLSLLVGLLAFTAFSGVSVLSPTRLGWVMANFDTPTMFLGWQYFRDTPWLQWPLGLNPLYGYDAPASIVLSDSIPLLALLFKPFSAWLPEDFQYMGLWVLACFLLQAWFACRLLQRFSASAWFCLLGSAFFATASIFLNRVYLHPALAGHWLLLAGFVLYLGPAFRGRWWLALLAFAATIHAYLLLMAGAIWAADLLQRRIRREISWATAGGYAALTLAATLLVMWALGYFLPINVLGVSFRSHANLLFPFWTGANAFGFAWSGIMPAFAIEPRGGDGFGYFGVGFMLLVACALVPWRARAGTDTAPVPASAWIILGLACMGLLVFALGNEVYAGERLLWSYAMPAWLDRIYGVFRGAGRLMWLFWYLVLVVALYRIATRLPRRAAVAVLAVALVVQGVEFAKPFRTAWLSFALRPAWKQELVSPPWEELAGRYRRVVFLMDGRNAHPYVMSMTKEFQLVTNFAAKHGMGINQAYVARMDEARIARYRRIRVEMLSDARFEADTLYVITNTDFLMRAGCRHPERSWMGRIDGIDLLVPHGHSLPILGAMQERACPP